MQTSVRADIRAEIAAITPFDELETAQQQDALAWVDSGVELCRLQSPDVPPKHLVSYFALVDDAVCKVLLVHHKKAGLWLPPGGHVDPNEHPSVTVMRECHEELDHKAVFAHQGAQFVTVTPTVNTQQPHTDVSLWYTLAGNEQDALRWDEREFHAIRWWSWDDILAEPIAAFDPHLHRFIQKIKALYAD